MFRRLIDWWTKFARGCGLARALSLALTMLAPGLDRVAAAQCTTDEGIRYVRPSGSDGASGLCWASAYETLNKALDQLNNNPTVTITEIRVAGFDGTSGGVTYRLSDSSIGFSSRGSFMIKKGCVVAGGYRGVAGGGGPDERDLEAYETILSGDLDADDPPSHSMA